MSKNDMKKEYDFSKGERGKFYSKDAKFSLPIYLDAEIFNYFSVKAKNKGMAVNDMLNDLLKKDIALIEGVNKN